MTQNWLLEFALDHVTLGRVELYSAILEGRATGQHDASARSLDNARVELDVALAGLRSTGQQDALPTGFFARAWLRCLSGPRTGTDSAQADLDEAWEVAERGSMKLHMADIHLYRARLFFREPTYPWDSPAADLAAARKLIEQCGYWRRKEELEDAEAVILA